MPFPAAAIVRKLSKWYATAARDLPWRRTKDPYKIWISEVILQQTRVDQGLDYYLRFTDSFPSILDLAASDEDRVLHLWQGLGYYSRARNLHAAAKIVATQYGGVFPTNHDDIRALPGIGDYTAAAISAFAYGESYPAVDGNLLRVLSRLTASDLPIDTLQGKRFLSEYAQQLVDAGAPSTVNQSLMELGALVCVPRQPKCEICPINKECQVAFLPLAEQLPVKSKKNKIRHRYLYYLLLIDANNRMAIHKRQEKDIWQGLNELLLVEREKPVDIGDINHLFDFSFSGEHPLELSFCSHHEHQLSHQKLHITFFAASYASSIEASFSRKDIKIIPTETHNQYAFPIVIRKFLDRYFSTPNI